MQPASPHAAQKLGIAIIHQEPLSFPDLSVAENIYIGHPLPRGPFGQIDWREMLRKRYSRARPCTPMMARQQMGVRAMLYRLRAKIDLAAIAEEEVRATGWDRSDYAPAGA